MILPVTQKYILLIGKQYLQNRNIERSSLKSKTRWPELKSIQSATLSLVKVLISKLINFMWSNIKSTARCILLDEYAVDTPKECLTNIFIIFLMNKYNLDLTKNESQKRVICYGACYWAFDEVCSQVRSKSGVLIRRRKAEIVKISKIY